MFRLQLAALNGSVPFVLAAPAGFAAVALVGAPPLEEFAAAPIRANSKSVRIEVRIDVDVLMILFVMILSVVVIVSLSCSADLKSQSDR